MYEPEKILKMTLAEAKEYLRPLFEVEGSAGWNWLYQKLNAVLGRCAKDNCRDTGHYGKYKWLVHRDLYDLIMGLDRFCNQVRPR